MLREVLQWAGFRLRRVPRRHWMCLVVALCAAIFEIMIRIERIVWYRIVRTRNVGGFNPYIPGAYTCPYPYIAYNFSTENIDSTRFVWCGKFKGGVYHVLFWVPVITQLPSGVWADLYGGHRIIFWSLVSSSFLHLLTPFAVSCGDSFYIGVSLLRKIFAGMALPASLSLLAQWALPEERTTFVAVLYSFVDLGTLTEIGPDPDHWQYLFYVSGAVTLVAAALWWKTARVWQDALMNSPGPGVRAAAKRVPLMRMVTDQSLLRLYLLAVAAKGAGNVAGERTVYDYLQRALMYSEPLTRARWLTRVFSNVGASMAVGVVSDRLVSTGRARLPEARRLFVATASVGAALSLLLILPSRCNVYAAFGCFVALGYFNVWKLLILTTSLLDVAPCLAGSLFAVVDVVSFLGGRLMFQSEQRFIGSRDAGDLQAWAVVFVAFAVVVLALPVPYLVFGPFYELPWARRPSLDAAPNTIKARIAHVILSVFTIVFICVFIIVISIML